ncbi:MAG: hypothetical protein CMF29_00580 [Kiritimatiellaceae bacterium]|nr:hypothetical protein [Kiritimatiellaceae bacterium]
MLRYFFLVLCLAGGAFAQSPAPSVIYVGNGFFDAPYYHFYTNNISANNNEIGSVNISSLSFLEGNTYTFERLSDISPTANHPFMLSDDPDPFTGSYHFGPLSLYLSSATDLSVYNGLINGESFSITIPEGYNKILNYYCRNQYHDEMVSSFSLGGSSTNITILSLDVSKLVLTEIDFNASQVEISNYGSTDGTLSEGAQIVLNGTSAFDIPTGTYIEGGGSIVVPVSSLGLSGDIWIAPNGAAEGQNLFSDGAFDSGITGWSTAGGKQSGNMSLNYNSTAESLELTGFNNESMYWHAKLAYGLGVIDASINYELNFQITTDVAGDLRIYLRPVSSSAWPDRIFHKDISLQSGLNNISENITLDSSISENVIFELQVGSLNGDYLYLDNIQLRTPSVPSTETSSGLIYGYPTYFSSYAQAAVTDDEWYDLSTSVAYPSSTGVIRLMALDFRNANCWLETTRDMGHFFDQKIITDPYNELTNGTISVGFHTIVTGLNYPIGMVDPDDLTGRKFIYQQTGQIKVLNSNNVVETQSFIDIQSQLYDGGPSQVYHEYGLLGVALHPNFKKNGRIYFCASYDSDGTADFALPGEDVVQDSVVIERDYDDTNGNDYFDFGDSYTERELMRVEQPRSDKWGGNGSNHNSGRLEFDHNGYLLISFGDGGNESDMGNGRGAIGNGQDISNILGSIVRIDIEGNDSYNGMYGIPGDNPFFHDADPQKLPEIYAYGFRNPWTMSVDMLTGIIYSPDSGERTVQELNIVQAGGNYGWRIKEGSLLFDPIDNITSGTTGSLLNPEPIPNTIDPIAEYDQSDYFINIIGGFVYRGDQISELYGKYICGDYAGQLMYLDDSNGTNTFKKLLIGADNRSVGNYLRVFGQDAKGELYFVNFSGELVKIVPLADASMSFNDSEVNVTAVGDEQSTLTFVYANSIEDLSTETEVTFNATTNMSYSMDNNGFFKVDAQ